MRVLMKALPLAVASAICAASGAHAAIPFEDQFNFSGFGTLGLTRSDTNAAEFRRDQQPGGATKSASFDVDSNVGLQLTGKATDWLSATVQVLAMQRSEENITTEVEWAFVKAAPIEGLAIRAGRMALPMFLISDSRNVGYANNWVRPPNEVYGLALFSRLEGGDISYRLPLGSSTLTATVMAGDSTAKMGGGGKIEGKDLRGANLMWETSWGSLRAGRVTTKFDLGMLGEETYTFTGFGATFDHNNVVGQAEYVMRDSKRLPDLVNAKSWYVLGGYRFGSLLPFASYASTKPKGTGTTLSGEQTTSSVGLRWDAFRSTSIKFQVDQVKVKSGNGISFPSFEGGTLGSALGLGTVTVGAISVDYVF